MLFRIFFAGRKKTVLLANEHHTVFFLLETGESKRLPLVLFLHVNTQKITVDFEIYSLRFSIRAFHQDTSPAVA